MGFRDEKRLKLHNRGLEVHILMIPLPQVPGKFTVTRIERLIGGMPSTTHVEVYDEGEAIDRFEELATADVTRPFEFGTQDEGIRLQDVDPAAQKAIDDTYKEDR